MMQLEESLILHSFIKISLHHGNFSCPLMMPNKVQLLSQKNKVHVGTLPQIFKNVSVPFIVYNYDQILNIIRHASNFLVI